MNIEAKESNHIRDQAHLVKAQNSDLFSFSIQVRLFMLTPRIDA